MSFRGDRLRELRLKRKKQTSGREGSQNWTANRIGAHVTSLSDWERGANEPSGRHVASLATLFGVAASYFYVDDVAEAEAAPDRDRLVASLLPFAQLMADLATEARKAASPDPEEVEHVG